jgi:two-component system invasion response regulator UvrY
VNAIRKVAGGGKYVSEALAEKLAEELDGARRRKLHESLSDREFQVMGMLATGRSVQEISNELALSVKTVRTYRERILDKLHLKNDVDLAHYAIEHSLIPSRES